jgi:hypothetical protein
MNLVIGGPSGPVTPEGVVFNPNSLILPDGLSFDQWKDVGSQLRSCQRALNWWIGDWLAYGQLTYKDYIHGHQLERGILRYASELLGVEEGCLANWKWISSAVSLSSRKDRLTWSAAREIVCVAPKHHYEMWIKRATEDGLSKRELRQTLRLFYAEEQPDPVDKAESFFLQEVRSHVMRFMEESTDWTPEQWDGYLNEYWPIINAFKTNCPAGS